MLREKAKFDNPTKQLIGARAGWRCSFPGCGRVTVGPGPGPGEYAQSGTAAHIYSSSEGGPRGVGALSLVERKAAGNGIWLCAHHGKVVDNNRGDKYPPELLRHYKLAHEARIEAEHEGLPMFRFRELTIHENPVFVRDSTIKFGKVTLLEGGNASGKSTILRWLDAVSPSSRLWVDDRFRRTEPIRYSIALSCPEDRTVGVARDSDRVAFFLDGKPTPFNPVMTEIVFGHKGHGRGMLEGFLQRRRAQATDPTGDHLDDVAILAEYMNVNPLIIPSLIPYVSSYVENQMENPRIEERGGLRKIAVDDTKRSPEHRSTSIHRISGSMASRLVLDLEIAMANLLAEAMPTFLFLSVPLLHLDARNLRLYVDLLLSQVVKFQTVFESVSPEASPQSLGWSVVRLSRAEPRCRILQVS